MGNRKPKGAAERVLNVRRMADTDSDKINFNFKYLDKQQVPPGQTIEQWGDCGLLIELYNKMQAASQLTVPEARTQSIIHCFPTFPQNSRFTCPQCHGENETWSELTNVGNQLCRVVGFIKENTFYMVFLDKDHLFYPIDYN